MKNITKIIFMIGLPASGKSTKAKEIAEKENAVILSSDDLRQELYDDVSNQDNNGELFEELYRRAKKVLESGRSVIIDATNINSKRRITTLERFKKYYKECYYMATPLQKCFLNNVQRERKVPDEVIRRMYSTMHVPNYFEGWNKINIIHYPKSNYHYSMQNYFEDKFYDSYNELFGFLRTEISYFNNIYDLPHDSSYHSFSVSRHTYYVLDYINKNYNKNDKLIMQWAALLHDTGKYFCKNFKPGSRYANFIGHENVSAQIAVEVLSELDYMDDFILDVAMLALLHMRLLNNEDSTKLKNYVGEINSNRLEFFREADTNAK